jgi:pyruvate-ferredoxin/flavodoxin oxidoreductase
VDWLNRQDRKTGVLVIRLYRPFPVQALLDALPASVRRMAVLDRTKEPGAGGEPLLLDVQSALIDGLQRGLIKRLPWLSGGRYGLSKEFTPAMCAAVFEELACDAPRPRFTVGIVDDVSGLSLAWHPIGDLEPASRVQALFFGLGADGTVGANKNSIKIIGELEGSTPRVTSSTTPEVGLAHRLPPALWPRAHRCPWLIEQASFIGCHQWVLSNLWICWSLPPRGRPCCSMLPMSPSGSGPSCRAAARPHSCPQYPALLHRRRSGGRAQRHGQSHQHHHADLLLRLAGILPRDEAIALIKESIEKSYARKGPEVVTRNFAAVDDTWLISIRWHPGR